jgi:hypothetical protein
MRPDPKDVERRKLIAAKLVNDQPGAPMIEKIHVYKHRSAYVLESLPLKSLSKKHVARRSPPGTPGLLGR